MRATSPYLNRPFRTLVRIAQDPSIGDWWICAANEEDPFHAASLAEAVSLARAVYGRDCIISQRGH